MKGIRKWQISYDIAYMCNLKRYKWTFMQNRNRPTDIEKKLIVIKRGWCQGLNKLGGWDWHMHTALYKTDNQQGPTV